MSLNPEAQRMAFLNPTPATPDNDYECWERAEWFCKEQTYLAYMYVQYISRDTMSSIDRLRFHI